MDDYELKKCTLKKSIKEQKLKAKIKNGPYGSLVK